MRILALITLTSALVACGGGGGGSSTGGNTNTGGSSQTPSPAPEPQPEPAPEPQPEPAPEPQPEPEPATYSANLSWSIPSSRKDGTALEVYEIGGYEIQHKLASESEFTNSTVINDAQQQSHVITNLIAGNYQFRIASFDTENIYSDFTDPIAITIGQQSSPSP